MRLEPAKRLTADTVQRLGWGWGLHPRQSGFLAVFEDDAGSAHLGFPGVGTWSQVPTLWL